MNISDQMYLDICNFILSYVIMHHVVDAEVFIILHIVVGDYQSKFWSHFTDIFLILMTTKCFYENKIKFIYKK